MTDSHDDIHRDSEIGRRAHARLVERLDALVATSRFDPESSSLPGWTAGMIVTHLARNADGHRRMIEGAALGEVWEQYDGGVDARTAGIEAGRGRDARELLADLRSAIARLEHAWASTNWVGAGHRTLTKETPIVALPMLRVREVELHHVDLDIGYTFDDLDPTYVRHELRVLAMSWTARQPMGLTTLPNAALALAPAQRLAWLTGRLDVEGLEPAGIF